MQANAKDVGVLLTNGLELIEEFDVVDWNDVDLPLKDRAIWLSYDASRGFDDITIETSVGTFRVQVTRISNDGE